MNGRVEIKGGAGEFEAAIIAVVLDHVRAEEKARAAGRNADDNRIPKWVRALNPELYPERYDQSRPD